MKNFFSIKLVHSFLFAAIAIPTLTIAAYSDCCYDPCVPKCCDFTASADYLYWNVCRSNTDFVIDTDLDPASPSEDFDFLNGQCINIGNHWHSGVRVNLGYQCDEDFGLNLHYTYLRAKENMDLSGSIYIPKTLFSGGIANEAQADYSLNYNVVDLEAGSWMDHSCQLKMRPFLGLRFAWIDQELETVFSTDVAVTPDVNFINTNSQTSDLTSYGFILGGDLHYDLCDCFNLIAQVSFGAHYGDFSWRTEQIIDLDTTPTPDIDDAGVNLIGSECRALFTSDIAAGIEYELNTCGCEWTISAGYELHTWINLQNFPSPAIFASTTADATLLLHGLYVRLGTTF